MRRLIQAVLVRANRWHSVRSYEALIARQRRRHKGDPEMAMIAAIGSQSREDFERQGDGHVEVLMHNGLRDGMSIYDLGCGSGRTAMALQRSGWTGHYKGADIVRPLVEHLKSKCAGYEAIVHRKLTIAANSETVDIIFHWSVFTHLYPEECFLYMEDSYRALRPGGRLVFSFLEVEDHRHRDIFRNRVNRFRQRGWSATLDTMIHRDWIRYWAQEIGFADTTFTGGASDEHHVPFWQALAAMSKPR